MAVIGLSGRFPGSASLDQFWDHLQHGRSFVQPIPADRLHGDGLPLKGSFLDGIDQFDAEFFQISPREAARMDPQQRLLLQLAWAAVEDAGYRPAQLRGSALGVFVGAGTFEYADRLKSPAAAGELELGDLFPCLLANRISQLLDVHGPSELASSACASSGVALHRAVLALQSGECDLALAGGINLYLTQAVFIGSRRAGVLSEDGFSRVFNQDAQGWGRGEGAGVVLLKPLARARSDGDSVYAVIRGTAVNHAGATTSLLAPNFPVQLHAVVQAYQRAGASPDTVSLVVAQGTGAEAADAFELQMFECAFAQLDPSWPARAGRCAVACLKPNLGHLESASGIASLIVAILALRHRRVPGIAQLSRLNPRLDAAGSPFRLSSEASAWEAPRDEHGRYLPRRASVHNFGYGGTTVHIVLEEHLSPAPTAEAAEGDHLILLSARGPTQLRAYAEALHDYLRRGDAATARLADLAWTLQVGRDAYAHRFAILTRSKDALRLQLEGFLEGKEDVETVFRATVTPSRLPASFGSQEADRAYLAALGRAGAWATLAELWLRGACVPWEAVPRSQPCRRVSLPTYPFAATRYWIDSAARSNGHLDPPSASQNTPSDERQPARQCFIDALRQLLGIPPEVGAESVEEKTPRALGLDSLRGLELLARVGRQVGATLPMRRLLGAVSVRELADELARLTVSADVGGALPPLHVDPLNRCTPFPLTEIQLAYLLGRAPEAPLGGNGCHLYWEWERPAWDVSRLEAAWNRLITRHDMLRAVIRPDGLQQVLAEVPAYRLEVGDVRHGSADDVAAHLAGVRQRLAHECRPPEQWPLFHVCVSLLPDGMRLHLSLDLLIADALSVFQLLEEWAGLHDEPERESVPPAVQFRDYVLYLEQVRKHERYRQAEAYWEARLDDLPAAPELPWVRDPASLRAPRYRRWEARLAPQVWGRVRQQFQARGLTDSAGLVAAFGEVLGRWSRSPRFTINLTVAQRLPVHPDIGAVVGDFTSTILLAFDRGESTPFAARAHRLQERMTEDLDHALVSGVHVLGKLSRRCGETVLMPVVFTSLLGHAGSAGIGAPGKFVYGVTQTPQVYLDCQVLEDERGLYVSFDVAEELFPPGLVDDLFGAYAGLLERLAADATWDAVRLPPLPANQLRSRAEANATAAPVSEELLYTAFLRQVQARPQQCAVAAPGRRLTYQELHDRAAALAAQLQSHGARPGQLVAVVAEKGWQQLVGVLGVAFSGAAYLPVAANLPERRVRELLQLGEVRVAVVASGSAPTVEGASNVTWIPVEDAPPLFSAPLATAPATPYDLAYVIFTSGSTGVPKGVMISHRGAVNTLDDINRRFEVGAADRVLALSALGFDLSVYDIFGVLGRGGAVVVPEPDHLGDPDYLAELAVRERVTLWNSVPSYFQLLVEACRHRPDVRLDSLRLVLLSGDWIPVTLPDQIRRLAPAAQVVSLGGATEASVWSILYPIRAVDPAWASIPYGKPLANQQFLVLDERFEDCPDWVPGELFIGGTGVALGYWRDETKTGERFPRHPVTGERLYRTGDRGRYWPDGTIEFLGRDDLQVKVGGHRVELGEIEAALAAHPDLQQAAVVVFTDAQQQRRLAAFCVARDGRTVASAELRSFLQARLPAYMVPVRWSACAALPRTANGKLDRKALAAQAAGPPGRLEPSGNGNGSVADDPVVQQLLTAADVLKDSAARQAFVRERRGVRQDLAARPAVTFTGEVTPELRSRYARRSSAQGFVAGSPQRDQLAGLLAAARGIEVNGKPKFLYPSAGGTYCLQVYVFLKTNGAELPAGAYYYHPLRHELQLITADVNLPAGLHLPANQALFDQAAFAVFLVADLAAIRPLYGDLGLDLARLEAGYLSQVLVETAPAVGLGLCPVGHLRFEPLRPAFGLSGSQVLVHTLAGGLPVEAAVNPGKRPAPAQQQAHRTLPLISEAAPRTEEIARVVAEVWAEVLHLPQVDPDAHFFELGGTSFAVVAVQHRLAERLGTRCGVTQLFQFPTVRALAAYLAREGLAPAVTNGHARADEAVHAPSRRGQRRLIRSQISQSKGR